MARVLGVYAVVVSAFGCAGQDVSGLPLDQSTAGTAASIVEGIDCGALPLPSNAEDLIATFEEGSGVLVRIEGRAGSFYMYNDGTGTQMPPPGGVPPASEMRRCGSRYSLCMSGRDFTIWGAGMGSDFAPRMSGMGGAAGSKQTYDASVYRGVGFWGRSNGPTAAVSVALKDKNTAPEGNRCDPAAPNGATACNDDWMKSVKFTSEWQPFRILFRDLRQSGWGKMFSEFQSESVYSIQFQVGQGTAFDICIDDLVFLR